MKFKFTRLLLSLTLAFAFLGSGSVASATSESFSFTAVGDYGASSDARKVLELVKTLDPEFHLALGDLSYDELSESRWCNFVKAGAGSVPFILLTGNHESDGSDGDFTRFAQCLPFNLNTDLSGIYPEEYYFDYPKVNPVARFIMTPPGLTFKKNGRTYTYDYTKNGDGYKNTERLIDEARGKNIPWIIVGMHKVCISTGDKPCEIGEDFPKMLIDKKVDLVLAGHVHSYERTYPLTCLYVNPSSGQIVNCIGDTNRTSYGVNKGTIFVTVGTGGVPIKSQSANDKEAGYFASRFGKNNNPHHGALKVDMNSDVINAQFVDAKTKGIVESFKIEKTANAFSYTIKQLSVTDTSLPGGGVDTTQNVAARYEVEMKNVPRRAVNFRLNNSYISASRGVVFRSDVLPVNGASPTIYLSSKFKINLFSLANFEERLNLTIWEEWEANSPLISEIVTVPGRTIINSGTTLSVLSPVGGGNIPSDLFLINYMTNRTGTHNFFLKRVSDNTRINLGTKIVNSAGNQISSPLFVPASLAVSQPGSYKYQVCFGSGTEEVCAESANASTLGNFVVSPVNPPVTPVTPVPTTVPVAPVTNVATPVTPAGIQYAGFSVAELHARISALQDQLRQGQGELSNSNNISTTDEHSDSLKVLRPNNSQSYDLTRVRPGLLNIAWNKYTGDFDNYLVALGNSKLQTSGTWTLDRSVSKRFSTQHVSSRIVEGVIKEMIANNPAFSADEIKNDYYIEVIAVRDGLNVVSAKGTPFTIISNVISSPQVSSSPYISSVDPISGWVGSRVTLRGTGFTATGNKVKFGNMRTEQNPLYSVNSTDGRTISFNVPLDDEYCYGTMTCPAYQAPTPVGVHRISVTNANGQSNEVSFTVATPGSTPAVTVSFPSVVNVGSTYNVTWTSDFAALSSIISAPSTGIYLVKSDGTETYIGTQTGTARSFAWTIPSNLSGFTGLKIKLVRSGVTLGVSNQFSVNGPSIYNPRIINITMPTVSFTNNITSGFDIPFSWNSTYTVNKIWAQVISSGDAGIKNARGATFSSGSTGASWSIIFPSSLSAGTYILKVCDVTSAGVSASSVCGTKTFTVTAPTTSAERSIRVVSPNGGQNFTVGDEVDVNWSSTGFPSTQNVNVSLFKNGSYVKSLASNIPINTGSLEWTIPDGEVYDSGAVYKIFVGAASDGGSRTDYSDGGFSISRRAEANSVTLTLPVLSFTKNFTDTGPQIEYRMNSNYPLTRLWIQLIDQFGNIKNAKGQYFTTPVQSAVGSLLLPTSVASGVYTVKICDVSTGGVTSSSICDTESIQVTSTSASQTREAQIANIQEAIKKLLEELKSSLGN